MDRHNPTQARIADYIRPLTSRWWLILIAVVVATGAVYAYYSHKPDVYTSSTLVYYQDPGDPVTGTPSLPSTDRTVADEASLLDSFGTAEAVSRVIGFHGTPPQLLKQVSISSKEGEDFIQVAAQAGTAAEAARIANAFASNLVSSLVGGVNHRLQAALALSNTELAQLPKGNSSLAQQAELQDQISRLVLALKVPTTIARQVDPAVAPPSPSAPKPLRDALFAFILSLVGAVSLAYGVERFDRRLKNPEEMETAYERPLLAVLPHTSEPSSIRDGEAAIGWEFREPFRVLRTNLELESLDAPPRTIVVSSAMPGEGKSTVVRNLALAFREIGKSVVVVDLDLRHPSMAEMFQLPPDAHGITEVLRHEASLDDAIIRVGVGLVPFEEFMRNGGQAATNGHTNGNGSANGKAKAKPNGNGKAALNGHNSPAQPEVALLLSGVKPANPTVVLASDRLVEVLNTLRERYDVVLIDTAPLLAVSDSVPLLRYADATLFVGRLDVTTRDTAKRLNEFLGRLPDLNLLGVVANDLSRMDASGYGYGYGYGQRYNEKDDDDGGFGRLIGAVRGRQKQAV